MLYQPLTSVEAQIENLTRTLNGDVAYRNAIRDQILAVDSRIEPNRYSMLTDESLKTSKRIQMTNNRLKNLRRYL